MFDTIGRSRGTDFFRIAEQHPEASPEHPGRCPASRLSRRTRSSRPAASEPWVGLVGAKTPTGASCAIKRQPALLLLLRAEHGDRLHGQAGLYAEEGAQAAVAAVELEVHQAVGGRAHRRAAVALDPVARNPQASPLLNKGRESSARAQ
jgi:hypothetical protein